MNIMLKLRAPESIIAAIWHIQSCAGAPEPISYFIPTALECVVAEGGTESSSNEPPCDLLGPTRLAATDGLLPSEGTFLLNSAAFGDKLQVRAACSPVGTHL